MTIDITASDGRLPPVAARQRKMATAVTDAVAFFTVPSTHGLACCCSERGVASQSSDLTCATHGAPSQQCTSRKVHGVGVRHVWGLWR